MTKIRKEIALTYDDVQLVPKLSKIPSRLSTSISTKFYSRSGRTFLIDVPIISAAMDTVTNGEMANAMASVGGMGIIHRYQTVEKRIEQLLMVTGPVGVSVGLDDSIDSCLKLSERANLLNIDVAHAHTEKVCEFLEKLRQATDTIIMVGNIATAAAAGYLIRAGADVLKVGIGGGSICSTRMVTGFGVPNVTAIMDVVDEVERQMSFWEQEKYVNEGRVTVVADGGIKHPCDIAKALAAGADAVMLGSMLAGTDETPGEKTLSYIDGRMSKKYRGMASKDAQDEWRGMKNGTAAEGVTTVVTCKGPVANVVNTLAGGLRSALTYAGAKNLNEFYHNTEFVQVTQSGVVEASPHILMR